MKVIAIALLAIGLSHSALGQQKTQPVTHKPIKPAKPVLSAAFKRTVAAAIDPTSTEAEVRSYVRDTRLLIMNSGDNLVFAKLLIAVNLLDVARNDDQLLITNDLAYEAVVADYKLIESRWEAEPTPEISDEVVHMSEADAQKKISEGQAERKLPVDEAFKKMTDAATFKHSEALRLINDKFSALRAAKDEFAAIRSDLGLQPILTTPEMK